MEVTIDTVNKNLKAIAEYKERYWKAEAKITFVLCLLASGLENKRPTLPSYPLKVPHAPAKVITPPTPKKAISTAYTYPHRSRKESNNLKTSISQVVKPDWYSDSESEDESAEVLAEEQELHLRKASDRVAKEVLISNLNKILKDENRSPMHLAKVARVNKELEEYDLEAETTPAEEKYRDLVKAEVREGHYRKDKGPLKSYLRNKKVIT
ncbi:hypothetical protein BGX38DRAFT_1279308 [Terfezia claveryi]|nr:hypothetical protein BGX38DRAFT_1279308 [Terfezia claveryi]